MIQTNSPEELKTISNRLRADILKMIFAAQSGHPGGSLSAIDVLTTLFFSGILQYDPKNPKWEERDYFILSKGHAAPALYAVLAEAGYFSKTELLNLRKINSLLQGHPSTHIPGIEVATGSLGQGLSVGTGIALGLKQDQKSNRVYVVLGDGETQEGQIYEAAMAAAHYKLDNLCAVIDHNTLQIDGTNEIVMSLGDIGAKWKAFGWNLSEIDGHDFGHILKAFKDANAVKNQPTLILAHTVKGKGAPCAEGNYQYHGKPLNENEMEEALAALGHA